MIKPVAIPALESFARDTIGDGRRPNVYIVTDRGTVVTVTRNGRVALAHWRELASRRPLVESALESRAIGVLACVEPVEDDKPSLRIFDDSFMDRDLR